MDGEFIGGQLRAARKLKGVTTTRVLARRINRARFGEKVIGQIERGERPAQDHEIAWLATALDVPTSYLTDPVALDDEETQLDRIERRLDALEGLYREVLKHRSAQGTDMIRRLDGLEASVEKGLKQLDEALSARTDALLPGIQELLLEAQAARREAPPQTASTGK